MSKFLFVVIECDMCRFIMTVIEKLRFECKTLMFWINDFRFYVVRVTKSDKSRNIRYVPCTRKSFRAILLSFCSRRV